MKIQKIIISVIACVALSQCKKDSEESYSNENIVIDNAQASLYFHTVFREAEDAWAFIHSKDYEKGVYTDPANTSAVYKTTSFTAESETKDSVFIEYHDWKPNHVTLTGRIIVVFDNDSSYRKDGKTANVILSGFSINGQNVAGESTMRYRKAANNNDQYTYTLLNGSAICEKGNSMPVLISCAIANAQYERVKGSKPLESEEDDDEGEEDDEDDVWAFSGTMSGMLHNDPNLKYTNTVTATPYMLNDETKNGRVHFTKDCRTASEGISQVRISGRPDIVYIYVCSYIYFESTTLHLK